MILQVVQDAEGRLLRILWFVALLRPDIVCVQELDNFAYVSKQLAALGYDCGAKDAKDSYQMLRDRAEAPYEERLNMSRLAFAPKTDHKKGVSMARRLLEKLGKPEICGETYAIDDEGCAIFWHRERLTLLGGPDFRALPGQKDVDDFIGGLGCGRGRASRPAQASRTAVVRRSTTAQDGTGVGRVCRIAEPQGGLATCDACRDEFVRKIGVRWAVRRGTRATCDACCDVVVRKSGMRRLSATRRRAGATCDACRDVVVRKSARPSARG